MGAALPRPVSPAGSRGQAPDIPIPTPAPSTGLQQKEPAGLERGLVPELPGEQAAALQQPFQRARRTGSKRLPPLPQKARRSHQCYCGALETPAKEDLSLISWEAKGRAFPGTCRGQGPRGHWEQPSWRGGTNTSPCHGEVLARAVGCHGACSPCRQSLSPGDIAIHKDPENPSRSHRAPARHPLLQPAVLQITKKSFQNKGTGAAGAQPAPRSSAVVAALNRAAEGDGAEQSEPPSSGVGLAPRRRRVAASCAAGSASPCRHSSPWQQRPRGAAASLDR